MSDAIDKIITNILRSEGWPKYTDRASDRGGPTKGGITLETLRSWRHPRAVIAADVEALDETEVRAIYRARYVIAPGFGSIADEKLRAFVVDCGVLHGQPTASKWLQQAVTDLGASIGAVDGVVGPKTVAAVNSLDATQVFLRVAAQRLEKLGAIVTADARAKGRTQDQALNCAGWCNRLAEFLEGV